ncbi:hypothetical protein KIN_36440 [Litoreibacter roseus]|uniref:Uncharacterized protein n=1 Tax=Litoreibacter roseus TaxID=2601869 RepID=A0A6N6JL20_9RHOB|nr:hypothetical protein KIN_36440 [Litoreibacter roseus]
MSDDPRIYHNPALRSREAVRDSDEASAPKGRPSSPTSVRPEMIAGMPRLLRGAHDLSDEAFRAPGRRSFVADTPRLDADVAIALAHARTFPKSDMAR